jgi:hypothetical protein
VTKWRFADTAEDGEAWLRRPSVLQVYVDYEPASASGTWRRVMVVTKSWLENHMRNVKHGTTTPLWAGLPPMIVVPDANGEDLRRIVDSVIQQGGMDLYSEPLNALPNPVE